MERLALLLTLALLGPSCGVQGAGTTTTSPGCGTLPADIEFLLDTSGSVTSSNFNKVRTFVKRFADSFQIGANGVHIGVATFDTHVRNEFWMNEHLTRSSLDTAIQHIRYPGGTTHTGEALKFVVDNAFTKAHGDRDRVANILIVVTDGRSTVKSTTLREAAALHNNTNINVFAVGVGNNLDQGELHAIASSSQNVFTVTNFDALDNLQATLKRTACEVNGHWSQWGFYSPCTKSCGGGTQYRERTCTDPAPANGGKDCEGDNRQDHQCNTKACPTQPPPTTTTTPATTTTPIPGCGVQPADILFIVDASGSVGNTNFHKTLDFITNMTKGFNIGPNEIQEGMITFDSKPYLQFHLNKFQSKDDIVNAVQHTRYTAGNTATYQALKYATDTSFTAANGARPNAAKIAIVITDGKSSNPSATAQEAQRLRNKGVTVFSIGVGSGPNQAELRAMASDPDNEHVFVVNNFDALSLIKGTLQQKACEVKPTMNIVTPPIANASCGGKADIVFLLDKSGSVGQSNFNKMLEFVKDVSSNFDIGPDDVQVGVDTYSTAYNSEFTLGQFGNKNNINTAVDAIPYTGGGTNTGPALTQMTANSFTTAAGHRAGVPKVAIVVTDGRSNNPGDTATAAQKARDAGIHVLAIGVGNAVDDHELDAIASDPDDQNVFRAANFDSLKSLMGLLAAKACEQTQQVPQQKPCGTKADIVFMLDSSGSVGSSNFKLLLSFVNSLTKDWDVGQDNIRIGVEKFSSRPYTEFHLNHFNDKQQMLSAINNIKYQSGSTNTGDALSYMKNTMFNTNNGDRPGVPNIGIVITDGKSNHPDQTKAQALAARNAGITLFSVGVGNGISKPELNEMATDPDSNHVFTVDDFSKLAQIKALFQQQTCDVIPASVPAYVPTAQPSNVPGIDPCQDNLPNCASYDLSSCTGFVRWAQDNCPRYCGFCSTSIPTIPPPCVDVLDNCPSYAPSSCTAYKPWALDNCRKYCGFCADSTIGTGYFGKCFYKGQQYAQGAKWMDGCAYDCECTNAAVGHYTCYNKCPTYYNLPPQCTLVQQSGDCCLQPVCNFDARYQTTSGQNVGDLNGNKVCVYNGRKYYQSQTWTVGCDLECICDDAGVGLYACQSKCASYGTLPANCKLVKPPGECCAKPQCEFNTQVGTFTGRGQSSGPGDNGFRTTPPPCVDKLADCPSFDPASCTSDSYRPWALDNCRKTCNLCNTTGIPKPGDVCIYQGHAYNQGQQWDDGCEKTCVCENAAFGYYRCDKKCPEFYNMPPGCTLVSVAGQCCKSMRCDSGTITGSQTVPNTIGAIPIPYIRTTLAPGLRPGGTLAPGQTIPPYLTPVPGQTFAPGIVPGQTLAPGYTIPWYLTPGPGMTYAPTPSTTPAPLMPGQTLLPGQTIPPYITPVPGQTFAPNIIPGQTLAPGMTVPVYLTPAPGQTYAPHVTNPYATPGPIIPGGTLAPGQIIPPYITPAPGYTFGPGIIPGQTLAPGVTVPHYLTPGPGRTYAPGITPPNTPAPLIPGLTLPPGQTIPPYITPVPGQTFAPGIRPGQTLAPGVTVPHYLTPAPGQTYAPVTTHPPVPLIPGITLPQGQTIPSYITPVPGQTFAPGIVPGHTLAPGVTVPQYLTPRPGQTYSPDTTPHYNYPIPGLRPGGTLAPGMTVPSYITPVPGQTFAPGIMPGQTLAPGMTIPPNLTPAPGQTYAPDTTHYPRPGIMPGQTLAPGMTIPSYITPVPGQTFAPGIRPGQTLAPGVTVPSYLTPVPGQTYAPDTTRYPIPGIMPGHTLAPGMTIPSYITPLPGQTFAPGIVPGQTLAPGMTVPPNLTPAPGQTYAPDTTRYPQPGIMPGQTLAPGMTIPSYITPLPGQTFAPGIQPGQTVAPGVTIPIYLTPRPGQTYAPDTTPGIQPGKTLSPGQTLPSYITPVPGHTFAPGIRPGHTLAPGVTVPLNLTPRPGQTYAPDTTPGSGYPIPGIMPGGTLAPGQTVPPYATPVPGQTFAPGIVPGQTVAPGVTLPWWFTPTPGQTFPPGTLGPAVPIMPGQTLAPGQTLPPYITPAPGQTFAPGILPGQTLAPGVTVPVYLTPQIGQTYGPNPTQVSGNIPMLTGNQAPQKLSGCVYKNTLYQQGQRWSDGCDFTCVCEDGNTGRYRCSPKCLAFNNMDPQCTMQNDPNDPCCKMPSCPAGITVVPQIGQAITGFAPAINPNAGGLTGTGTGQTGTGTVSGIPGGVSGGSQTGTVGGTQSTISGRTTGCIYKSQLYHKGDTWQEGCQYTCECVDDQTGYYRCTDVCPNYQNLPPTCRLIPDPNNNCCQTYVCDVQVTTTQAPAGQGGVPTPATGVDYCVYNGRYYRQGEEWNDGCSYTCRCEDAQNQYHQCTARCATYSSVPLGCRMVPDTKDPQCCKMPECDSATGQPGSGITGSQTPLGFIGTYGGTGRPAGSTVSNTGYRSACIYKGQIYSQGQTWQDGCDFDCECTDAQNGVYRCTDRCQRYAALPSDCQLVQDPNDQCCVKAECAPPSSGMCRDVKNNCYTYGKYACEAPYSAWAKDNCAYYCGFCGSQTTAAPANCQDKLPNCQDYGHDGCVGTYESWARYNCPMYCGYCGTNSQVTSASSVINVNGGSGGVVSGGTCVDKLPNCDQYGPESCIDPYRSWAIDNCAQRCNLCAYVGQTGSSVTGAQGQMITGRTIGCYYDGRIYAHGEKWQDGCDYNCTCVNGQTGYYRCGARCMIYDQLPAGCTLQKDPNECCSKPVCNGQVVTGDIAGCLYKGQVHPQGTQWTDGCEYRCTCQDGTTGRYRCEARCVTWQLPAACSLNAPAAGKCCQTPNCPAGYTVNYPPGYVEE